MYASLLNEESAAEWDAFVEREPSFSMTQSWEWGEIKKQFGWQASRVAVMDEGGMVAGAQMLIKRLPFGIDSLAYIPRGPVGDWTRPDVAPLLFESLHQIARNERAIFLKVEPPIGASPQIQKMFAELDFCVSPVNNQPAATIIMDIAPSEETILRSMRDSTRRKIPSTQRKGVVTRLGTLDDLPLFYHLMQRTARRTGFTLHDFSYYKTEFQTFFQKGCAALFLAEYAGQTLAAHVVYGFGDHAAFFHQASENEIPSLNPNCLLVWEEIKWARSKGCRTLDLWGIPDEIAQSVARGEEPDPDRTDGLWGVYRFKRGFSKNIVCYLGAVDYVYSQLIYRALTTKALNQHRLEHISNWMDTHLVRHVERDHEPR